MPERVTLVERQTLGAQRRAAATQLQARFRGNHVRQKYQRDLAESQRERERAATRIQAVFRGKQARVSSRQKVAEQKAVNRTKRLKPARSRPGVGGVVAWANAYSDLRRDTNRVGQTRRAAWEIHGKKQEPEPEPEPEPDPKEPKPTRPHPPTVAPPRRRVKRRVATSPAASPATSPDRGGHEKTTHGKKRKRKRKKTKGSAQAAAAALETLNREERFQPWMDNTKKTTSLEQTSLAETPAGQVESTARQNGKALWHTARSQVKSVAKTVTFLYVHPVTHVHARYTCALVARSADRGLRRVVAERTGDHSEKSRHSPRWRTRLVLTCRPLTVSSTSRTRRKTQGLREL
jgi:hypothetical protein